ncbi:TIGR04255 family protein [Inconstantimicrobium mannanitabidum]|uniref:Uncharacterized protein n=1 Tax=Inconstantimicrobium mannanitabidum TaxID=1604901 RepID=A0ACB5RAY8_9CLOT|nr:TIGR04255 family protein [Clostridium sp. TW13]GKX66201.1 hypothetical protein rsdtw13_14590 [Clostridium sp. TW13]
MEKEIKRKDLTSNLLSKVILRLDFLRIVNIQELVSDLQNKLNNLGFYLTNENITNEVEFQINDPDVSSSDNLIVKKTVKREQMFVFQSSKDNTQLLIGESCIIFNIDCEKKYCLEYYILIFCDAILLAQDKFKFIKFTRLGIRKINNVICKESKLYYLFGKCFFSNSNDCLNNAKMINYVRRQSVDNFIYNNHSFNVSKFIQEGFLENDINKKAYNVILDIDGYIKEEDIPKKFEDTKELDDIITNINDDLFHIFRCNITKEFTNDLVKGVCDNVEWGMKKND